MLLLLTAASGVPSLQVGTAHGRSIEALMRNSELIGLVGGIETVVLGDMMARETNGG